MATVDILLRTPGGPAAAGPTGGAPPGSGGGGGAAKGEKKGGEKDAAAEESKKGLAKVGSHLKGAGKFFSKNLGLQFGMSSMLKQSQVFTSFIGVIFQLVGALVDVILAPLIPLFFPLVRILAGFIPHFQTWSEGAYDAVAKSINTILGWYNAGKAWGDTKIEEFKEAWKAGPKDFGEYVWNKIWTGLQWVWNKVKNDFGPWVWEQIKGLGKELANWLQTTGGRIFGWFATAYVQFSLIKTGVNKLVSWSANLLKDMLKGIGSRILRLIKWGARQIPKLINKMGSLASKLIKVLFPGFGHVIVAAAKLVGRLLKFLLKLVGRAILGILKFIGSKLLALVKGAGTMLGKGLVYIKDKLFGAGKAAGKGLFDMLKNFVKTTVKNLLTKLGGLLGKLPIIGGTLKKIGGLGKGLFGAVKGIGGTVASKIGGKGLLTGVKTLSKMSKAIPVLGSVATLGFGAVETYNNFKNHGWKAGLATAGKTIAATTLAATGNTVASMALDIGGTMAINKFLKNKAAEGAVGGPTLSSAGMAAVDGRAAVVVNISTANGESVFDQVINSQNQGEEFSFELSKELQAADQT